MIVVGISGHIGCGKSELGKFLAAQLRNTFGEVGVVGHYSFGDEIKIETAREFNFRPELCYTREGKETLIQVPEKYKRFFKVEYITVRYAIQWYGTDYIRGINPRHWTVRGQAALEEIKENGFRFVIVDDMRAKEEAWLLRQYPSFFVRLERYDGYQDTPANEHKIERELDDYADWNMRVAPKFGLPALQETARGIVCCLRACYNGLGVTG